MKSLFIDTTSKNLIVAVLDNSTLLSFFNEKIDKDMSVKTLPIIKSLLDENNLKPNDIDTIYAVNGPGSFTGIRVGLTIAKTYAWGLKKKVVPISSLEVLASSYTSKVMPLIDARRGYVYTAIYDENLNPIVSDIYVEKNAFIEKYGRGTIMVSFDDFKDLDIKEPNIDIERIISKHQNDEGINPHKLNPNYLKLTEAEEKLNKHD